jgi:lipopolysaccharide/colanic/teichoic acid biosynthesis glycosyltransferase
LILIAITVRITSRGPVIFRQRRTGLNGRSFIIYKFRTMPHQHCPARSTITTSANQPFTPIGPFLRHWKLDELPQIFNVLRGDMSLVGPRPRVARIEPHTLACRPGITGRATLAFFREESALTRIPEGHLNSYYDATILPLKRRLDDDYMAAATCASDLGIILRSVFRRGDENTASSVFSVPESDFLPG